MGGCRARLLVFFFFFFTRTCRLTRTNSTTETVRFMASGDGNLTKFFERLINGTAFTFGNFIWYQGYILVIVLALAGSVLVGNDFFHGSLPFYLSKPIGRWHYVLGKCLAIGALINLLTTLPAVLLWVEAGLLYDWETYYLNNLGLLAGIIGYGLTLTITLSLLVVATAVWVRRTVPLAMIWMGSSFLPMLRLAGGRDEGRTLAVIDLWNTLPVWAVVPGGGARVGAATPQPEYWEAWVAVGAVCAVCLLYLRRRIQAVEIVQ